MVLTRRTLTWLKYRWLSVLSSSAWFVGFVLDLDVATPDEDSDSRYRDGWESGSTRRILHTATR